MLRRYASICLSATNGEPSGAVPAAEPTKPEPAKAAPEAPKSAPILAPSKEDGDPAYMAARLERERAKILKDLGVDNPEDAKKAIAEHKARTEAAKTTEQKNAELLAQLTAKDAETAAYRMTLGEMTARMMVGLSEEQKTAVTKIAGDDPAKQLATINALAPTWAAKTAADAAAVKAAPASTSPGKVAPDGSTVAPSNHRATYEALQKTNPFEAAAYGLNHAADVFRNDG